MADGNEESLLWGLNFARQVFLLKLVTLCAYHALKCRYVRQRRRQEGLYRRSINRMKAYVRWRARRNQIAFQSLISGLSRSRTVVRTLWSKKRSECWWDVVVEGSFEEGDWIKNFRMSHRTFCFLCQELEPYLVREDTRFRQAISVRKRVAVALWRLATNADYRTIGHLFGISKGSICVILDEFCTIMAEVMLPRYIKIPTGECLDKVMETFEQKWGFPQCAGAVDGSHIPIKAPVSFHADYYNRKGWHSIILQGVVDSAYTFIDINVGWPGKVHDARVFANSTIFKKGEAGNLFPETRAKKINGVKIPVMIIADAAYPLLNWVQKPFPDHGTLSREKLHFNYRLSRARMVAENAFGRLKGRWRCLLKQNEGDIDKMNNVVAACCILHNMCEMFKEEFDPDLLQEVGLAVDQINHAAIEQDNGPLRNADEVRNALVQYCQDTYM